jgi:hypothetical protein
MPISHNQLATYESCPRQYEHKYILNTKKDEDYVENVVNFHFGSVAHKFAEFIFLKKFECQNKVEWFNFLYDYIYSLFEFELFDDFENQEFKAKMYIVFLSLYNFRSSNKIEVIAQEFEVQTAEYYARIDAVLNINDVIHLVDFKTCASFDPLKPSQLHNDMQLNFYYNMLRHKYNITQISHIDLLKPRHKMTEKDNNNFMMLSNRLFKDSAKNISDYYRLVSVSSEKIKSSNALDRIFALTDGIKKEIYACNYANCINKFKQKCPFFKQCNKE